MRIFGILFCLVLLGLTGYSAIAYKAPRIEADIQHRATQALAEIGADEIGVSVQGRHVRLEGSDVDGALRERALAAVAALPGVLGPTDALDVMADVSPYRLDAQKDAGGGVTIEGLAPDEASKEAIEADARALFGEAAAIDIGLADGAPEGDWRAVAGSVFDALATLHRGRISIEDSAISLEGEVASEDDLAAIDLFAEAVPEGFLWTQAVDLERQRVEPYTFLVVRQPGEGFRLSGFAPDDATRQDLVAEAELIAEAAGGGLPVVADIELADGMPDEEWPSLVKAGIGAMRDMESGRFEVIGNDVAFSSDAASADGGDDVTATQRAGLDAAALPDTGDGADSEAGPDGRAVSSTSASLTIDKVEDEVWSVRGVVPDQAAEERIVVAIKTHAGVQELEADLERAGGVADEEWLRFAADRLKSLDEVRAGRLSIEAFDAHLIGVVETPEDIEPVRAELAVIDDAMTVDLQPVDPRPLAVLDLDMSPEDGVELAGALPAGLSADEALAALGIRTHDGELAENGRGEAEAWRRELGGLGVLLPKFERLTLSLDGGGARIDGVLDTRADAEGIRTGLEDLFGDGREAEIDLAVSGAVHDDGAERTDPLTGEKQVHRRGFWLPAVAFDADAESCRQRSVEILAEEKINFGRGEAELDERAEPVLNRLAAIAIACLEQAGLELEIGGHTDSRGARSMNEELSQARADAVREALTDRGVAGRSLVAIGYGDALPIADNATDEGRAANRRITFEWRAAGAGAASAAEG